MKQKIGSILLAVLIITGAILIVPREARALSNESICIEHCAAYAWHYGCGDACFNSCFDMCLDYLAREAGN